MLRKYCRLLIPGTLILGLILASSLANLLSPYDPNRIALGRPYAKPSLQHPLGLDNAGRDILSRILHGGRLTLGIAISSILLAAVAGTILGVVAGYFPGVPDMVIMRGADVLLCFPPIILGMAIVTFLGTEPIFLTLVIALLYTPRFVRVVYAAVQTVKHNEYVEAARALGSSIPRLFRKEIIPNILAPIMVQISLGIGHAIILETGLSFVGLGPPPPTASWGRMIEEARRFMRINAMILVWPALTIGICVIAFNMLGDALRDYLDPRLRHTVTRREGVS
ncbi:MAG: ABC transporter permease [Nitrospinota bacterium]|nr:MAG: ABC transporter permease [Nitrospinota bacterium]